MTGDDSLALDSITSDYRFMLEHDTSMLEIALAAVSFEDCSLEWLPGPPRLTVRIAGGVLSLFCYWFGKCWMGFIRRPDANCNSSTDSKCFTQVS